MDVIVTAKCDVPDRVRREVHRRVEHATRFLPQLEVVEVVFGLELNPRIAEPASVELRARTKDGRIRAQGWAADHRGAVDVAVARFERQLTRQKARVVRRRRVRLAPAAAPALALAANGSGHGARPSSPPAPRIVERREVPGASMLAEEAAAQLELLGHDVFLFTNSATGRCSVVYRRPDEALALLELTDPSD